MAGSRGSSVPLFVFLGLTGLALWAGTRAGNQRMKALPPSKDRYKERRIGVLKRSIDVDGTAYPMATAVFVVLDSDRRSFVAALASNEKDSDPEGMNWFSVLPTDFDTEAARL